MSIVAFTGIKAQTGIITSGGNASGIGGSVSYSLGQVFYTRNTGSNGSVTQGVQQPYEISVITSTDEAKEINLTWSVYPNPATEVLTLKTEEIKTEDLCFQLYDITGKIIENKKIETIETIIQVGKLLPGIYFLKVSGNGKEVKTFKIIKK